MIEHGTGRVARLPHMTTVDLNGEQRALPDGRLSVLLIAYQRWQQLEVDTWIPALEELERHDDGLSYYELPVVGEMNALGRRALDHFMRRGIPDHRVRSRTLTFYEDSAGFRAPLGIRDEDHIAVVLVDGDGLVLWRASGPHTPLAGEGLVVAVQSANDADGDSERVSREAHAHRHRVNHGLPTTWRRSRHGWPEPRGSTMKPGSWPMALARGRTTRWMGLRDSRASTLRRRGAELARMVMGPPSSS